MPARTTPSVSISEGKIEGFLYRLLWFGIIGPVLFAGVFLIDGLLKPGYSALAEAISYLEVGSGGWIQQVNFIVFGLLLVVFLVGYTRSMRSILEWAVLYVTAFFLLLSDMGWILAGFFIPNPFRTSQFVWPAILHQVAFNTVFLPLAIAWLILGIRFILTHGWRLYGCYSLMLGIILGAFSSISTIYIINPNSVAGLTGNVSSPPPYDGLTNRIVLLAGPLGWYVITAILAMRRGQPSNQQRF